MTASTAGPNRRRRQSRPSTGAVRHPIYVATGDEMIVRAATRSDQLLGGLTVGTIVIEVAHADGTSECYDASTVRVAALPDYVSTPPATPLMAVPVEPSDDLTLEAALAISHMQTTIAIGLLEEVSLVEKYDPWTVVVAEILAGWQSMNDSERQYWDECAAEQSCINGLHLFVRDYGERIDYNAFSVYWHLDPPDDTDEITLRKRRAYWTRHLRELTTARRGDPTTNPATEETSLGPTGDDEPSRA
jgi:hypothetical protein